MVNYDRLPSSSRYFDGTLYQAMNEDLDLSPKSRISPLNHPTALLPTSHPIQHLAQPRGTHRLNRIRPDFDILDYNQNPRAVKLLLEQRP